MFRIRYPGLVHYYHTKAGMWGVDRAKTDQDDKTTCSWIFNKFNSAINQIIIVVITLCVSPSHDPNHQLVNIFSYYIIFFLSLL